MKRIPSIPHGSHRQREEMRHVKEQPFHRAGCVRFTQRYMARGMRGRAGSRGEGMNKQTLEALWALGVWRREGRASPAKFYLGGL